MNGSDIPESWEENSQIDGAVDEMSSLNVNACAFVPSFLKRPPQPTVPQPAPVEAPAVDDSPVENNGSSENNNDVEMEEIPPPSEPVVVEKPQTPTPPVAEPVVEEQASEPLPEIAKEDHLNVVFVGHVDAGKSTLGGQIMYLTGMVDRRTLDKYEREAKEKNRETWYLSWALDTNQEERDKGKTVEVGRAFFRTNTKRFTILDAPGHRSYVPNMIGGTTQADIAILVISARRGEFETGFERGGQTREHAVLVKVAGVQHLIVLINKMDDSTVKWNRERYDKIKKSLLPFLKKIGFNQRDVHFMPCSGFTGANLKEGQPENHPWYTGLPLIPYLDQLATIKRDASAPLRMPIVDRYKDMGVIVLGKLEAGTVTKAQQLVLQPNKKKVKVSSILRDETEVTTAEAGENVKLRLDGVEEDEISKGFVLCSSVNLCNSSDVFVAQIMIIEYKSIIANGFRAIMHLHSCVEEVVIEKIIGLIDVKTGQKTKAKPYVKQGQSVVARLRTDGPVCVEAFEDFPKMGRLALRDENITIAIGKVLKVE